MPSPFPGMDPYLEGDLFGQFHFEMTLAVRYQLLPQLAPKYYAFIEKYYLVGSEDGISVADNRIKPDVGVARDARRPVDPVSPMASVAAPMLVKMPKTWRMRRSKRRIAIRDLERRRLVTAIEVLSPANKIGSGRLQYLAKRDHLLCSTANLVEIDLVRTGPRLPVSEELPETPYSAFVSRAQKRATAEVWPISLPQALPSIPIPLRRNDADAVVDLQQAMNSIYEKGEYASLVDYRANPPGPSLDPGEHEWCVELLRRAGLRK